MTWVGRIWLAWVANTTLHLTSTSWRPKGCFLNKLIQPVRYALLRERPFSRGNILHAIK
ncbi:UNVERIFIED_CONTAM: hypothetical protein GTU68_004754 [Idotea baltica]|nr:hypothetical protein [Idotea baltica]